MVHENSQAIFGILHSADQTNYTKLEIIYTAVEQIFSVP